MSRQTPEAAQNGDTAHQHKEQDPSKGPDHRDYSVFTVNHKRAIVAVGSFASFFSTLSSSIYYPALDTIAKALNVSISKINLTITTYLVSTLLMINREC